jgi:hypothetical protein
VLKTLAATAPGVEGLSGDNCRTSLLGVVNSPEMLNRGKNVRKKKIGKHLSAEFKFNGYA